MIKTSVALFLCFFMSILPGLSQVITPGYFAMGGQDFYMNSSVKGNTAYIINSSGRLSKSSDHCEHWNVVLQTLDTLYDVAFLNADTGIVGCTNGNLYRTVDGGVSFSLLQPVPANTAILKVMWGTSIAYLINSANDVYRSYDYGLTWSFASGAMTLSPFIQKGAQFVSNTLGFVCQGQFGSGIYRTTNGGSTWTLYGITGGTEPYKIFMYDSLTGYATGDQGRIFKTTNSGLNWNVCGTIPIGNSTASAIAFISADTGFTTYVNDIYMTVDGGATWSVRYTSPSVIYNEIEIGSDRAIYFAGGYGQLNVTEDLGATWSSEIGVVNFEMHFVSQDTGFSPWGSGIIKTEDHGNTWQVIYPHAINNAQGALITFPDRMHGYSAGNISVSGAFMNTTTDGGTTWTTQVFPVSWKNINDIFFLDSLNGFVSLDYGSQARIRITNDGGLTWTYRNYYVSNDPPQGLYFLSPDTGFCFDLTLGLMYTFNQGITWSQVTTPTPLNTAWGLTGQIVLDGDTGFMHYGRYILKTVDRGTTWSVLLFHPFQGTTAITVQNDTIIAGMQFLYKSFDGGQTWTTVNGPNPQANTAFFQIQLIDTTLYAYHPYGEYLGYRTDGILSVNCNFSIQNYNSTTCDSVLITASSPGPIIWYFNGNLLPNENAQTIALSNYNNGDIIQASDGVCVSQYITLNHVPLDSIIETSPYYICPADTAIIHTTGNNTSYQWSNGDTTAIGYFTAPGNITVTFLNTSNCLIHDTISVLNFPAAIANASADTTICQGDQVAIGSSANNGSCSWQPTIGLSAPASCTPNAYPNSTTSYTLTVTTSDGCTKKDTIIVGVTVEPSAAITQTWNTLTCSLTGIAYQWYWNNQLIPGATAQSYTITQNGFYNVDVQFASGCWMMSQQVSAIVGIDEHYSTAISLQPNPTSGEVTLNCSNSQASYTILDLSGRTVTSGSMNGNTTTSIDLAAEPAGIYFLKLYDGENVSTYKIVKM